MIVMIDGVEYQPKFKQPLAVLPLKQFLYDRRKELKLTLDAASEKIGCSKSNLWELENGNHEPSLAMAIKIANAYNFNASIYQMFVEV